MDKKRYKVISAPSSDVLRDQGRVMHYDGYVNLMNKYGTKQDSTEAYRYAPDLLIPDFELCRHYESGGLFSKIIDKPADEAVKHGFTLNLNDPGLETFYMDVLDELDWDTQVATAIKWARLFGGSIIVMLIDDGRDLDEPVNWDGIRDIDGIKVYERSIVQPDTSIMYNFSPVEKRGRQLIRLGEPEYYNVFSMYGAFAVHADRCLVFKNGILPESVTNQNFQLWGMPEYMRISKALQSTITSHSNADRLLERVVQAIYKMKGLAQALQTESGTDNVLKRLHLIDMARGILNSMAIDADGEDYDFKSATFAGVKEVLDASCNMLSAVTDIPQTVFFGRSPAGENATGKSDFENYYNMVDGIRNRMIKRNLNTVLDVISHAGRFQGKLTEVPKLNPTFNPLWNLTEQEQVNIDKLKADTALVKAQTAEIYVNMQALDPSEVRRGLAKTEEFIVEELLDDSMDTNPDDLDDWLNAASAPAINADGEFTAAAAIVTDGERILIADRTDGKGVCGPGGSREDSETPLQTVMREAREEFGIDLISPRVIGQTDYLGQSPVFFICSEFAGITKADGVEMTNARFVPIPELFKLKLFPPFEESLQMLVSGAKGDDDG